MMSKPIRHGTTTAYRNKCRCAECRRSWAEYCTRLRAERRKQQPPRHDVYSYSNWGCRCEICSAAWKAKCVRDRRSRYERTAAGDLTAEDVEEARRIFRTAAREARKSGMPIVRPLFLIEPQAAAAWSNWWTYLYGPDILVSPIWQKEQRTQQVYMPTGNKWRDAWNPDKIYDGGQTITVNSELHQLPIFVRVGSKVELGDLNKEWSESTAIADTRPDLAKLDAELKAWFDKRFTK